jgi:hypothetical protein
MRNSRERKAEKGEVTFQLHAPQQLRHRRATTAAPHQEEKKKQEKSAKCENRQKSRKCENRASEPASQPLATGN